jgi:branched-chain amino acid transport system ATP-binding protein
VLAEGRMIAQGSPQTIAGDPRVVEAYLGRGAAGRMMVGGAAHG